jgi:hypothetical protein
MTRLWALLLLGACNSPRGALELRVIPPDDATEIATVRLFVGIRGERKEALRPPGYLGPVSAVWWERDRAPDFDDQAVGKPDPDGGYLVRYAFTEGRMKSVSALVAVGFDAADRPVALGSYLDEIEIPSGQILEYDMALSSAVRALPRRVADDAPGVQVWNRRDDKFACAQIDNVPGLATHGATTAMFGPAAEDMDCDGLDGGDNEMNECVRNEYMGQRPFASRADLTCVTTEMAPPTADEPAAELTVAGGRTCEDSYGEDPSRCSRSAYCLPSRFAALCERFDCDPFLSVAVPSSVPLSHVDCTLDARPVAVGLRFCENPVLAQLATSPLPITCGGPPALRDIRSPFAARIGTNAYDIEVAGTAGSCEVAFTARGAIPSKMQIGGLLAVPLTAPVEGRGLVLPVKFTVNEVVECPQTIRVCSVIVPPEHDGEMLRRCLRTPITSGTTVGSSL